MNEKENVRDRVVGEGKGAKVVLWASCCRRKLVVIILMGALKEEREPH